MASPRQMIALLVALMTISGCQGYKPLINPNIPELIINEGEPLEITCTSINDINIVYPEDDPFYQITTSEHEITPESLIGSSVKLKFSRKKTVFGDTGWYGCANVQADVTNKNYDDPNVSWIYVYVRSNTSAFIQDEVMTTTLVAENRGSKVLPCRPTSPELHVSLFLNYNDEKELELNENLTFDPKVGFTLKNLSALNTNIFTCRIDQNGLFMELEFFIKVIQSFGDWNPKILKDGLQYVTEGSTLRMKCEVAIGVDHTLSFTWITPRNSTSRQILGPTKKQVALNTNLITSELVQYNVTYDDEGEYICEVKSITQQSKRAEMYVHIYDPSIKFIKLSSHGGNRKYIVNVNNPVQFSAYYDGYPKPALIWYHPDGNVITKSNRYEIDTKNDTTTLKIVNALLDDIGNYTLQAVNDEKNETLFFTLDVKAKPFTLMERGKPFYGLHEKAEFVCHILSNPTPNITLVHLKCSNLLEPEDCTAVELEDVKIKEIDPRRKTLEARVETITDMSGKINCTACNEYGCDTTVVDFIVSDIKPDVPLGIIEPEGEVTVGDDIKAICGGSIYNFSSVYWLNETDEPIQNSERVNVTFENTDFTHQAILSIKDVKKSDEATYYCRALVSDKSSDIDQTHFQLFVNDPEPPSFTFVNMNGSEVTISAKESHNTIQLNCHAKGRPRPTVTWYKNDEPLELDEKQFDLMSKNQTLIIKYLMEKDSGTYSCVAKNRYGEIKQSQKYLVKGAEISLIWIISIVVVILILVAILIYLCIKFKREKMMRKELLEAGLMHFEEGALDCINPDLTVDDQAELLPYDRKFEFPREKLKLGKQLGSGAFGVVMKAEARGICADESLTTVAVKMVRRNAEPAYILALTSELKIMIHLGKHLNVVNLLGACTNNIAKRELLVIVEYCRYGNLHNYLLRHRDDFINQIDPETGRIDPSIGKELLMRSVSVNSNNRVKYAALSFSRSLSAASGNSAPGTETVIYTTNTQDITGMPDGGLNSDSQPGWRSNYQGDYKDRNLKPICTQDLLSWAFQVARGMEYLSQRKVLHGDLAARNILLAENNVVKICDFGLAKTMYKDDNYKKQGNGPVPIKWMAIESIRDRVFSTQSDIWSFGIVLWEFFTLAETPYPGMQAEIQYQKLIEGYRMEQPKYATDDIYDIILQCWKSKPTLRPSFTELVENIGDLLEEGVKMHYVELNSPYMDLNKISQDGKSDYLTMMSAPDHAALASPHHDYVNAPSVPSDSAYLSMNSPLDESGIFSPRPNSLQNPRFQFPGPPSPGIGNTTHSDGEDAPMLKKTKEEPEQDEDNYLKPIDVHKKREEFVRQREAEKRKERERSGRASTDRDSGYCNTPKGLELLEIRAEAGRNKDQNWKDIDDTDKSSVIIRTQDNYVNMPKQKDLRKDVPDSFMNPSYIFVESNKSDQEIL